MKAKKRLIYATGIIAVISIAGAFFFGSLKVNLGQVLSFIAFKRVFWLDTEFWLNFCFAVFGSSRLGLIMSWVEYFVERKEALEQYFSAAVDVSIAFAKAKYFTMYEPKELLMAYFKEQQWESDIEERDVFPARDELFQYVRKGLKTTVDVPEPEFSRYVQHEFDRKIQEYNASLTDTMISYIEIASTSIQALENAYGKLDFLLSNHLRAKVFDEIHAPIQEYKRYIREKASHFRSYVQSKFENTAVMIHFVDEIQQKYFRTVIKSDEDSETTIVYQQFVDDLNDQIEWLRCKMYREKYNEQEHTPLLWYWQRKKLHQPIPHSEKE